MQNGEAFLKKLTSCCLETTYFEVDIYFPEKGYETILHPWPYHLVHGSLKCMFGCLVNHAPVTVFTNEQPCANQPHAF